MQDKKGVLELNMTVFDVIPHKGPVKQRLLRSI